MMSLRTLRDLPSAPRARVRDPWELIGLPYVRNGNSPARGFDCFTLLTYVRWHWFGLTTPAGLADRTGASHYLGAMIRRAIARGESARGAWMRQARPSAGCAIGCGRLAISPLTHCGVWLTIDQGGRLEEGCLHALERVGVCWTPGERLAHLFGRVEFYELCRAS